MSNSRWLNSNHIDILVWSTCNLKMVWDHELIICSEVVFNEGLMHTIYFLEKSIWWPFWWHFIMIFCIWPSVNGWFDFMVLNVPFNNISVISWRSVLLVEKTTDLSQVTDKLYWVYLVMNGVRTRNVSGDGHRLHM
jgi:hypothetical protein